MVRTLFAFCLAALHVATPAARAADAPPPAAKAYDVVVVQATPGGIMTAVAAARGGCSVLLLDRTTHVGGLPANGLGATDIATRGATGGLFKEFVDRVKAHYVKTYGADSQQAKDCSDGFHFEPTVAEAVFEKLLAEYPKITVLKQRQFDAKPENVTVKDGRLTGIVVTDLAAKKPESYSATVFVDASYEGDLAAAAGAPFRTRREGQKEYNEPLAGRVYKQWRTTPTELGEGSTGEGDDTIQAFNFRICLTRDPALRVKIEKPTNYSREEFASIVEDVKLDRWANKGGTRGGEIAVDGIGRVVNMVKLPNGKTDANNQHAAFVSTDLPEENYPWPTADWAWRDKFATRLREYNLGLLYFVQNDPALPEDFRQRCQEWGLAKDEYTDNGNFPRQAYVREGRRIEGEHLFTALDALPTKKDGRPPVYADSITASHYALDSHAHHKREPNRVHLDGFLSHPTAPYTVPYGVMVPKKVEGLLTPVPVSGTHIGFSTLRMEPCWMAMGQAAGVAAAQSVKGGTPVRKLDVGKIQVELVKQGAVLIYFRDLKEEHPNFAAIQYWGLRGLLPEWVAKADAKVTAEQAKAWAEAAKVTIDVKPAASRGAYLQAMYEAAKAK
jgi:hypothetical protein